MRAYFDDETWKKIGEPDLGSRIFIKRGRKKYFGKVIEVHYGSKKGIQLGIKVDKVK